MISQGVRRIKKSLNVDIQSVKFIDEELYQKLLKVERISGYLKERNEEIIKFNQEKKADKSVLINGRHLTNIGVFRIYIEFYQGSIINNNFDKNLLSCKIKRDY